MTQNNSDMTTSVRSLTKQLVYGIDFGTSSTKVIIRDLSDGTTELVDWNHGLRDLPHFLLPSTVAVDSERLRFAADAERSLEVTAIRSFKVCFACKYESIECRNCPSATSRGVFSLSCGVLPADFLVTVFLAYVFQSVARRVTEKWPGASVSRWINIGAPIDQHDQYQMREKFQQVAFMAEQFAIDVTDGVAINDAQHEFQRLLKVPVASEEERRVFVMPETAVATMSFLQSASAKEGLYALVDVGAGTTDVSFCRVSHTIKNIPTPQGGSIIDSNDTLAFYEALTSAIGSDNFDFAIADLIRTRERIALSSDLLLTIKKWKEGITHPTGHLEIKGQQIPLSEVDAKTCFQPAIKKMLEVYRKTNFAAFHKEALQNRWRSYFLILLGGGSRLSMLRRQFERFRPSHVNRRISSIKLSAPSDLKSRDKYKDCFDLIAIAYGLSYAPNAYPRLFKPKEVKPWRKAAAVGRRLDRDDLYPK